ncbi:hypothetical protein FVA81_06595 [Rhizobium sp. WL3]|uniref:primase-helicase family protein n=1 Tax=Rhizobium sp. WL3 TaxID=2603277 RepID=UPI0011C20753|nr:primase-helicase family protein [Rhizobium sp. WL3]QEE44304.1 hypothetical protein FVA81_06595 [Rhizobium sp. WL3]
MSMIDTKIPVAELVTSGPKLEAIQQDYIADGLTPPSAYRGDVDIFNDSENFPADFWDREIVIGLGKNLTDQKWKAPRTTVWGFFTRHLFHHFLQEEKEGRAFLQGALTGSKRKNEAMTKNHFMVFDIDNGQRMDDVREMLIERDLFALLYTSHSHRKPATLIKKDLMVDFVRNVLEHDIQNKDDMTADHARQYLLMEKGYLPDVLEVCELGGWEATPEGEKLIVSHCPLDRFRAALPLADSFDFHASLKQADQIRKWKDTYCGVADALGVFIDGSCIDPARLMYLPAHPARADEHWRIEMVMGKPLNLEDHTPIDHKQYLKARKGGVEVVNAYTIAGGEDETSRNPIENKWLIAFRDSYGPHLGFVDLVHELYNDECPRADFHSDSRGGFQCDDGDGREKKFHAHCHHLHCAHLNGDPLAWLDFIVTAKELTRDDLLQFVPDNLRKGDEGDTASVSAQAIEPGNGRGSRRNKNEKKEKPDTSGFNDQYALLRSAGKVRVIDTSDMDNLSGLSEHDFYLWLGPRAEAGKAWLRTSGSRRQYRGIEFYPGEGRDGFLNTWRGFAHSGDAVTSGEYGDGWALLEEHIRLNVCQGDDAIYDWLMTWFADIVQNPAERRGSCVLLRGDHGVGKSKVFDLFRKLLGNHTLKIDKSEQLTGNFNAALSGKMFVQMEEAVFAGSKRERDILKNIITTDEMLIERKFMDAYTEDCFFRIGMTTNAEWAVNMESKERRYLVLECGNGRLQDTKFFAAMDAEMAEGGFEAWMADLMAWKPDPKKGGWDMLRQPPKTKWAQEQIELSKPAHVRFFDLLNSGELMARYPDDPDSIQREEEKETIIDRLNLITQFEAFMKNNKGEMHLLGNADIFRRLLETHCAGVTSKRLTVMGEKRTKYFFPPLQ